MGQILFPKLSYKLTGLCFKIHTKLGRFCREKQYAAALEALLRENQISYQREYDLGNLNPLSLEGNIVDFLIENKILLEIKAKKFITKDDYNQMQRYLQGSNLELGLIFNFRNTSLKPKRVLNTKLYSENSDDNSDYSDRFEILEHKADLKIRAFGKTKEELFLNMIKGMTESQKPEILPEKVKREIKIKSFDLEALLVDFLSEVLYLIQVNKEIYNDIKFTKFSDTEIEGELFGQKVKRFGEDIKAVTYHSLEVYQKNGTWQAIVLFDI